MLIVSQTEVLADCPRRLARRYAGDARLARSCGRRSNPSNLSSKRSAARKAQIAEILDRFLARVIEASAD